MAWVLSRAGRCVTLVAQQRRPKEQTMTVEELTEILNERFGDPTLSVLDRKDGVR